MTLKRFSIIGIVVASILLIPLVSMLLTNEVQWDAADFLVGGAILLSFGLSVDFIGRKLRNSKFRLPIILGALALLILLWAELAVGIFGSPLAGS